MTRNESQACATRYGWLCAALVIALPSIALAAGGGHAVNLHPEINWWAWNAESPPVGWFLVNFVIFVFLLVRLAGRPVNVAFARRSETIKNNVETNARELAEAEQEREQWHGKLESVEDEAEKLVKNSIADGQREKEKTVQGAKNYGARMRDDTGTIMEQETASAQRELQLEISLRALDKAESILRASIHDEDRIRLFDQAIEQLANGKSEVHAVAGETAIAGGAP